MFERPRERFAAYALIGFCSEVLYTGAADLALRRTPHVRFRTSPWMLPVYGLAQPLFEPLHDLMRGRVPVPLRAVAYGLGFETAEYASGRVLRRLLGQAPWDYSHARHHIGGLVRADYLLVWAAAGMALERVHDRLAPGPPRARPG